MTDWILWVVGLVALSLVGLLTVGAPFVGALVFPRAPRTVDEVLEDAFRGRPIIYLPDLVRAGELGPPERALPLLSQLFAEKRLYARAVKWSGVDEKDRGLCLAGPRGAIVAYAMRDPPEEQEPDSITPTTTFRRKAS